MNNKSIVLQELNAHGSLQALVVEIDDALYLFLDGPKFGVPYGEDPEDWIPTRSVWVANSTSAKPCSLEEYEAAWKEGKARALPVACISENAKSIDLAKLEFVWAPQGDALALMADGELLAFIPSSASNNWGECRGYSRDLAVDEFFGMIALTQTGQALQMRNYFLGLKGFWQGLCRESNWRQFQTSCMQAYGSLFGSEVKYAAIDQNEMLPKACAIYEKDETVYFLTVGASQLPQPKIEQYAPELADYVLLEFGLVLSKKTVEKVGLEKVVGAFVNLVATPWLFLTWFAPDVTCNLALFQEYPEFQKYSKARLIEQSDVHPAISFSHGAALLWFVPITEEEFSNKEYNSIGVL